MFFVHLSVVQFLALFFFCAEDGHRPKSNINKLIFNTKKLL